MLWTVGILLVALAFGQVLATESDNGVVPMHFEDAFAKSEVSSGSSRIVSGWEAEPGQIPYQVLLRSSRLDGTVGTCGGSVVHRNWVISSAQCTAQISSVMVLAGLVDANLPEYQFESRKWWNHPHYDESRPNVVQPDDISLIELETAVTYSKMLQRIRVQPSSDAFRNYANEFMVASGWGRLWTDGEYPDILNWVFLRGVHNAECGMIYGFQLVNNNAICARWYNVTSQSTCIGDTGGPLVHTPFGGERTLIGVSSFVAGLPHGCHSTHPAGFVRPGPFIPWMNEITGLDFDNIIEYEETTPEPTTTTPEPTTTTTQLPTTTLAPDTPNPEEEDNDDSSEEEEDPEIADLLKQLIIKVKVKVKINDEVKRKLKLKTVDNL